MTGVRGFKKGRECTGPMGATTQRSWVAPFMHAASVALSNATVKPVPAGACEMPVTWERDNRLRALQPSQVIVKPVPAGACEMPITRGGEG